MKLWLFIFTLFSTLVSLPTQASLLDSLKANSGEDTFLPVEQAFPIFVSSTAEGVTANWKNADGYYLYQHRIYLKQGDTKLIPVTWSKKGKEKYDEAFGDIVAYYGELSVTFDISTLAAGEATLYYQGCADAGLCYPPQRYPVTIYEHQVTSDKQLAEVQELEQEQIAESIATIEAHEKAVIEQAALEQTQADNTEAEATTAASVKKEAEKQATAEKVSSSDDTLVVKNAEQTESAQVNQAPIITGNDWFSGRSALAVVGIFFLLGLGLTFTPCVLPMVPILTSVVLGQEKPSPARGFVLSSTYVMGMAITYTGAGLTVGLLGAGANIQAWMQDPAILAGFAILFVLLALSMFGLYELQLPSGLRNRLNALSQQQKGGHLASVFLIGVLSALVVSPCVSAPLAGALAYLSTTGDVLLSGLALFALSLGMGTPLIILGTTGASVLPKAGVWMDRIKYLFGFMLLAVAIWLVSRSLPESLVLALWGVLAVGAGISAGALSSVKGTTQWVLKVIGLISFVYGTLALAGAIQGHTDPLNPIGKSHQTAHETPFIKTESVAEVKALIANSDAPVMLDLYADWCISCKVMDKEIFAQTDAQEALSHLLWVQLDMTDNTDEQQDLLKEHDVFGPPTVLFFENQTGVLKGKIIGERHKEAFLTESLAVIPQP